MNKVWDKPIEGETDKSFEYFCRYRDLGAERTLVKVVEMSGKSSSYIKQLQEWSSQNSWVSRALSFDEYRSQRRLQEQQNLEKERMRLEARQWAERRAEFRERQWQISHLLIEKATEMLSYSLAERRWTFREAVALIQLGSDLAKSSAQITTDIDVCDAMKVLCDANIMPSEVAGEVKNLFDDMVSQIQSAFVQGCLDCQTEKQQEEFDLDV